MAKIRVVDRFSSGCLKLPGIVAHGDLRINAGRLRVKFVVVKDWWSLRSLAIKIGDNRKSFPKKWAGFCNPLQAIGTVTGDDGRIVDQWMEVDRRYFCLIALRQQFLTTRWITHESVHGAFAFNIRCKKLSWQGFALDCSEELIAHPAGEIARQIAIFCHGRKLYE